MSHSVSVRRGLSLAALGIFLLSSSASSQQGVQPTPSVKPTLTPIAETRLLMEGLANANYRGLEKLLKSEPDSVQAWTFVRGQALLIAETSNLLMLRPPKGQGQDLWFNRTMALRTAATELARAAASKNYAQSKAQLINVAKACTNCHQSFKVQVQIIPFAQETGLTQGIGLER